MKKHTLLLTLGSAAAIALPIATVVSCGNGSKEEETTTTSSSNHGNTIVSSTPQIHELKQVQETMGNITIANPVEKQFASTDLDKWMFDKVGAQNWAATTFNSYRITLPNSTHSFNISFDKNAHYTEAEERNVIQTWAKNANYGFAILTLDNIIITPMQMGSAGWGDARKDILVATKDMSTISSPLERAKEIQISFNTLQHEYGHHETSSLLDPSGEDQAKALVAENVIGSTMFKNSNPNYGGENARLTKLMGTRRIEDVYSPFFGQQEGSIHSFNQPFYFDFAYHMSNHMEFLNRAMNNLELALLDPQGLSGFYGYPDLLKYQIGESNKILNDDQTYTTAAQQLVEAYGRDVYGYANDEMIVTKWAVKGFSSVDFDFAKEIDENGTETIKTFDSIQSHYVTKDHLFAEPKIINNTKAFNATQANAGYEIKTIKFYKDTNKDGKLDSNDQEVTVRVRNISNTMHQ